MGKGLMEVHKHETIPGSSAYCHKQFIETLAMCHIYAHIPLRREHHPPRDGDDVTTVRRTTTAVCSPLFFSACNILTRKCATEGVLCRLTTLESPATDALSSHRLQLPLDETERRSTAKFHVYAQT